MTTKEFIKTFLQSTENCEKLAACKSEQEAYAIAKENGVTDDLETFKNEMSVFNKEVHEVSEDDLQAVIAAGNTTGLVTATATSASVVVSAVAIEAAISAGGAAV